MRTISYTFAAGEIKFIDIFGSYFRLLAGLGLRVDYVRNNYNVGESAYSVDAGYYAKVKDGFDRIVITSASAQTVKIAVSSGEGGYDLPPTGNVTVINKDALNGVFANSQKTVTSASGLLVAANASRRYLEIQNNDATGSIYVRVDGNAATVSTGRLVKPGESWVISGYQPSGAVYAIGDALSNANVVVIEG